MMSPGLQRCGICSQTSYFQWMTDKKILHDILKIKLLYNGVQQHSTS
jgi:myo-inositol-1-phosphate synthase